MQHLLVKRKKLVLSLSAALVGVACLAYGPLSHAEVSVSTQPQVVVHTYRIPNGVVRVESVSWGTPNPVSGQVVRLTPAQAQALAAQNLRQVAELQAQMQWQMRWMQRMMETAFAEPFAMVVPPPLPVGWSLPGIPVAAAPGIPQRVQPNVDPHSAPPIPISDVPGHQMVHCRWAQSAPVSPASKTRI
ncbi:hypothetical protein ACSSZE_17770 [Acidithiobacillus caldus]|uniref:Uncharacterized protein n=1 Tax=Acidithiobacillus caldus TaxID=33059 RepID=A0A1E7YRL5_9PROT|nr:hypothetical protein BAE30_16705 [Acidithiobacillus caldus]